MQLSVHLFTVLILHNEVRFWLGLEGREGNSNEPNEIFRYVCRMREKETKVDYVPNMDAGPIITLHKRACVRACVRVCVRACVIYVRNSTQLACVPNVIMPFDLIIDR